MKTRILALLFLILLQALPRLIATAQIKSGLNTVLWKIQYPGSSKISYLLGTNHLYGQEWLTSYPKIETLLNGSDTFICESLHSIDTSALKGIQHKLLADKRTSKELFNNNFDLVNTYFVNKTGSGLIDNVDKSASTRLAVIYRMFSYLIAEVRATEQFKLSINGEPMDKVLLKNAVLQKKINIGLDPIEIVTKIYSSDKLLEDYCALIVDLIKIENHELPRSELIKSEKEYDHLVINMKNYNQAKFDFNFQSKPLKIGMLEKRNEIWMNNLPDLLKSSNCFIAVGARHLDTKIGIIPKLLKMGFVIIPVDLN